MEVYATFQNGGLPRACCEGGEQNIGNTRLEVESERERKNADTQKVGKKKREDLVAYRVHIYVRGPQVARRVLHHVRVEVERWRL